MTTTYDPIDAILLACVSTLRTALVGLIPGGAINAAKYCDVQPEGRPPHSMGQWYVSVDDGGVQSSGRVCLKETHAITIYVSRRTGTLPQDRRKLALSAPKSGLGSVERAVVTALHGSYVAMNAATALLAAGDIFQQPLWYTGRPKTSYRASDWVGSESDNDTFLVRELSFRGMLRVQSLTAME